MNNVEDWVNKNFQVGFLARWRERWATMDSLTRGDMISAALIIWAIGAACGALLIEFAVKASD